MRVKPIGSKTWALFDADEWPVGCVVLNEADGWEFQDPNNHPFIPQRTLVLAPVLQEHDRGRWPTSQWMRELVAKLMSDAGEIVRLYLPWAPEILRQAYRDSGETQAQLAWLFALLAAQIDDPALAPVGGALERQAYEALTDLYAAEPPGSLRTPGLRDALKATFRAWQGTIANPDRAWLFSSETAREAAMLALVADAGSRRLNRLFRETADGRQTVRRLIELWFLPRYDLRGAERLKTALRGLSDDGQTGGSLDARPALRFWAATASQKLILLVALGYAIWWVVTLNRSVAAVTPQPLPILWVVYLLCGVPPALAWLAGGAPDTSTPRLLAGILVALIAVVMQQNWAGLATFTKTEPFLAAVLAVAVVIAAFRVLLGKVRHTTGIELTLASPSRKDVLAPVRSWWCDTAVRRCHTVWTRGLALAFLVSLFVSDLLGDIYLGPAACQKFTCFPGAIGHTFPGLVLLFTALLLFAGVFVQFLWEEKPITEGIA